jgi:hypothetical protein
MRGSGNLLRVLRKNDVHFSAFKKKDSEESEKKRAHIDRCPQPANVQA